MKKRYENTRFRSARPPEPFPSAFAIITAYNPNGEESPEDLNVAANQRLEQEIEKRGHAWFPVTGGSPDFSHVEPGYGIILPSLTEAKEMARRFEQEAIFWVLRGEVLLVSASDEEERSIGPWSELAEYYPRPGEAGT
jgi:hypothetical protein